MFCSNTFIEHKPKVIEFIELFNIIVYTSEYSEWVLVYCFSPNLELNSKSLLRLFIYEKKIIYEKVNCITFQRILKHRIVK